MSSTDEERQALSFVQAHPPPAPDVVFLDAKGGRGKTFVLRAVLAAARVMSTVAIAACFTGLAANDYPGGLTCHRAFQLPVHEDGEGQRTALDSTMSVDIGNGAADLLRAAGLIIIDEAPMSGRPVVSAVRRLLERVDAVHPDGTPPRKRVLIFSGDFQQISPVVTYGTREDCLRAWLATCDWWAYEDAPAQDGIAAVRKGERQLLLCMHA